MHNGRIRTEQEKRSLLNPGASRASLDPVPAGACPVLSPLSQPFKRRRFCAALKNRQTLSYPPPHFAPPPPFHFPWPSGCDHRRIAVPFFTATVLRAPAGPLKARGCRRRCVSASENSKQTKASFWKLVKSCRIVLRDRMEKGPTTHWEYYDTSKVKGGCGVVCLSGHLRGLALAFPAKHQAVVMTQ